MTWNDNWPAQAACKDDPDRMFVSGAEQHGAKRTCLGCPVRSECLAEALDNQLEWGVWGGMTERERRQVLKTRPNVASWRRVLEAAREAGTTAQPAEAPAARQTVAAIA